MRAVLLPFCTLVCAALLLQERHDASLEAISRALSMGFRVFSLRVTPCASTLTATDLAQQTESRFYVTYLASGEDEDTADDREDSQTSSVTSEPNLGPRGRAKSSTLVRSHGLAELSVYGTNPSLHPSDKVLRLAKWELGTHAKWFTVNQDLSHQHVDRSAATNQGRLAPPMNKEGSRRFSEPAALLGGVISNPGSMDTPIRINSNGIANSIRRNTAFVAPQQHGPNFNPTLAAQNSKYLKLGFGASPKSGVNGRPHAKHDPVLSRFESVDSNIGYKSPPPPVAVPAGPRNPTLWERRKSQQMNTNPNIHAFHQRDMFGEVAGVVDSNVATSPAVYRGGANRSHFAGSGDEPLFHADQREQPPAHLNFSSQLYPHHSRSLPVGAHHNHASTNGHHASSAHAHKRSSDSYTFAPSSRSARSAQKYASLAYKRPSQAVSEYEEAIHRGALTAAHDLAREALSHSTPAATAAAAAAARDRVRASGDTRGPPPYTASSSRPSTPPRTPVDPSSRSPRRHRRPSYDSDRTSEYSNRSPRSHASGSPFFGFNPHVSIR